MGETNEESKALVVIEQAMKMPFVKVDRKEFLLKSFSNYNIDMNQLIEKGPIQLVSKKDLDKVGNKAINNALAKSTSASFVAGLPASWRDCACHDDSS